jgi:hypothetical protein
VAYNYINNLNALNETNAMGSFADVVACLSPAYASIDPDRQATPEEHAFVASDRESHTSHRHHSKRLQASRSSIDKKASSIIKELQNHLDQSQATIARLRRKNEAMISLAHSLGAKSEDVVEAVYEAHEVHHSNINFPSQNPRYRVLRYQEALLSKASINPARRQSPRREKPPRTLCMAAYSDSDDDHNQPLEHQAAFTACPLAGLHPIPPPLPAAPVLDSDKALHFTRAALALPPDAAHLRDYFAKLTPPFVRSPPWSLM